MLDLQQLKTFQTVADLGNFSLAGVELGFAQSSVSARIQALERELGVVLFHRSRFSKVVTLTEEGRRTYDYARRILSLAEEAVAAIH